MLAAIVMSAAIVCASEPCASGSCASEPSERATRTERGAGAPRVSVSGVWGQRPQSKNNETIAAIVIHGNQIVTDDEVLTIAGISVGQPFGPTTLADVNARLKASRKFESVEVLKRYASIDDFSKITVVINASEGAVRIAGLVPGVPGGGIGSRVVKRGMLHSLMGMVILDAEDGYGVTYGARLAIPKVAGARSRLSFPLTWGGTRKAGAELEKTYTHGPLTRIEFGGAIQQRTNPAYEIADRRNRVWARAEKAVGDFRVGGVAGWQRVSFDGEQDDIRTVAVEATLDTRLDANLPRNAVFAQASAERLFFQTGDAIVRTRIDARGYLGLFGQQVLVGRLVREDANRPQPRYLRSLLGGWSNLRGFEAGFMTGDTLVATSLEWRMPITSPLSIGKMGVSVFVDWGTAYEKGERFRDQKLHRGAGAGLWMSVTGLRFGFAVAKGSGAGTRVSFSGGLTF